MLNLNNVPASQPMQQNTLIPANEIVRAIVMVKPGDFQLDEYGPGQWFKASQSTKAKWMELEFTIIGGQFDRRKFWDRVFVDGDKLGSSNIPEAKEIGLRTLRSLIDSANGLSSDDMSPEAQQKRSIPGVGALNGVEICAKVGVKKGTNGYSDQNKLVAALTPKDSGYAPRGGVQNYGTPAAGNYQQSAPAPQAQQQPVSSGAVPTWAQ